MVEEDLQNSLEAVFDLEIPTFVRYIVELQVVQVQTHHTKKSEGNYHKLEFSTSNDFQEDPRLVIQETHNVD